MAREFKSAPEHLQGIIREAAESNGLTYEELERQLWIESNYDPKAQGPVLRGGVRAQGIAQFVPATAKEWGVDVNDVTSSINGAAKYMRWLVDQFDGDKNAARAAYNWGIGKVKQYGMDNLPAETKQYLKYFDGLDSGTPGTVADRSNAGATTGAVAGFRERQPKSEHGYGIWDLGTSGTGMGDAAKANPFEIGDRTALQTGGFDLTTQTGSVFEDQAHYGTSWLENVVEGVKGTYTARAINWAQGKLDDDGWRPGNEDIAKLVRDGYGDQVPFISNANGSEDYKRRIKQVDDQREMARLQTFESPVGVFLQTTAGSMGDPLGAVFGAGVGAAFRMKAIAQAVAATKTATPAARAAAIEAAAHGGFGRMLAEGALTDFAAESGFQALESGQIDWHSVAVEVLMGQGLAATTAGVAIGAAGVRHAMAPWMNDADLTARELAQRATQYNRELALLEPSSVNVPIGPALVPENAQVSTPRTINTETFVAPAVRPLTEEVGSPLVFTPQATTPTAEPVATPTAEPVATPTAARPMSLVSAAVRAELVASVQAAQARLDAIHAKLQEARATQKRLLRKDGRAPYRNSKGYAEYTAAVEADAGLMGEYDAADRELSRLKKQLDSMPESTAETAPADEYAPTEADAGEETRPKAEYQETAEDDQTGGGDGNAPENSTRHSLETEIRALTGAEQRILSGEQEQFMREHGVWDDNSSPDDLAWLLEETRRKLSEAKAELAVLDAIAPKHQGLGISEVEVGTGARERALAVHEAVQQGVPDGTVITHEYTNQNGKEARGTSLVYRGENLLAAAAAHLAANATGTRAALLSKLCNLLAQRFSGANVPVRVVVGDNTSYFTPSTGIVTLYVSRKVPEGTSVEDVVAALPLANIATLVHEMTHVGTAGVLMADPKMLSPELQAARTLVEDVLGDLRAEITNRLGSGTNVKRGVKYANKDAHELLSQAMSDEGTQQVLMSMPSKRGLASRFSDFVEGILRILGVESRSRYSDLLEALEVILSAKQEYIGITEGNADVRALYAEPAQRTSHGGQKITGRTKEFMDSADNFRDNVETRPEVKKIRERINAYYEKFRGKLPKGFVNSWAKYMDTVGMNLARSENHYARWVGSWLTEVGVGIGRNGSTAAMRFSRTLLDYKQKYVAQLNEYLGTFLFGDYETKSFYAIQSGIYDQKKTQEFWQRVQTYRLQRRHDMLAEREHVPQETDRSVLAAADAMDRAASEMAEILKGAKLPEGADILTGTKAGATGYIRYQFEAELLRQLPPAKQRAVADQLVEQYFKKYVARDESLKALQEDPEGFTLVAHDKMHQRLEKLLEDAQAAADAGDAKGATARLNLAMGLRKQIQEIEANPEAFVAAQFAQIEKAARAMAEDHGRGYFERIIQNHEVRADGTTAWAQELGKRILAQDFAGQEITPEIAQIWKERLQDQMQDRTRMELDLLTEFGEGQKLLDYIQLNGNAMISSQGRAAAGRSALANFGITTDADADAVLDGATQAGCSDDEIRSMKKMLDLYLGRLDSDPETEALASFMSNMAYVMMMSKQSVQLLSDIGNAVQWAGMPAAVRLAAQALGNIVSLKAFKRTYDPKTLETAEGQLYAFFPGSVGEQFNAFMPNVEKIIGDVQPDQGVATRVAANMRNVAGHAFGSMLVSREVQLGLLKVAVQEVSASIITGKNWTPERMSVAGLTPEIVARIKEQFEKHAPELVATGGREGKANWHLWDDNEALQLYQDAVVRVKGYMTLEENPGESQAWAVSSPLARILLQFRGAGMRSAEKLAAAEFGIQGAAAGQVLGMQMLWAGALYTLRSLMAAAVLGEDEAEKYLEERQKPSDINFQAWLNLIPMSGIASDVVGVSGVFFGQGGVSGVVAPAGPEALDRAIGLPGKAIKGNLTGADIPVLNSPFLLGPAMQAINAAK